MPSQTKLPGTRYCPGLHQVRNIATSLAMLAGSGIVMQLKAPPSNMLRRARKPTPLSEATIGGMYRDPRNKIIGTNSGRYLASFGNPSKTMGGIHRRV